jgi:hypothetical protein
VDKRNGLEHRRGFRPTVGSNPTPSAIFLGWLGASHVCIGLGSGFILGGISAGGMLVTRRASASTRIAFGPFLCIGADAVVLLY